MSCVLKTKFDSTTNHLNPSVSPMFLNCLLLDLTVIIDLISIVHMDKVLVKIAKKN